mgnify:CR=1 FL=1
MLTRTVARHRPHPRLRRRRRRARPAFAAASRLTRTRTRSRRTICAARGPRGRPTSASPSAIREVARVVPRRRRPARSPARGSPRPTSRSTLADPEEAWRVLMAPGPPRALRALHPRARERREPDAPHALRDRRRRSAHATSAAPVLIRDAVGADRSRRSSRQVDLLLLPTTPIPAVRRRRSAAVDDRRPARSSALATVAQTYVFNLSGHPAISVPAGHRRRHAGRAPDRRAARTTTSACSPPRRASSSWQPFPALPFG